MSKIYANTLLLTSALFLFSCFLSPAQALAYTITTNSGTGGITGIGSAFGSPEYTDVAQPFTTIGAGTISSFDFCLYRDSNTSGTVTGSIYDALSGTQLGSGSVNITDLPANSGGSNSCVPITFTMSSPVTVAAATTYYLDINENGAVYVAFGGDGTGGGNSTRYNGSWNDLGTGSTVNISVPVDSGIPPASLSSGQIFSTTTQLISNPNQDFANGIFIFLFCMFGIIWLFKGRK